MITKKQMQDILEDKVTIMLGTAAFSYNTLMGLDPKDPDNKIRRIKAELTILNMNALLDGFEPFIQDKAILEVYQDIKPRLDKFDDQIIFQMKEKLATDPNLRKTIINENNENGFGMNEQDIERFIRTGSQRGSKTNVD